MFDSYEFLALEVVGDVEYDTEDSDTADIAFVDFKVRLRAREKTGSTLEGQDMVITERSRFLRDGDPLRWRYASGEVKAKAAGMEDIVLNQ